MAMIYTDEQSMLKEAADGFFAERSPISALRALRDNEDEQGYDPALWQEMIEMGFTALLLSENEGGTGFGYVGAGIVAEAMATTLAASPFMASSVVATTALKLTGSDLAASVAAGEKLATLAVDEGPHHAPESVTTNAEAVSEGYSLTGMKTFVPDGHVADYFIVSASGDGDVGLYLVEKGAKGLIVDRTVMADSRNWAKITLEGVNATKLDGDGTTLTKILDVANIIYAAELLGLSEAAFKMTMEYLKERKQFGRIIGSFQGLQHRSAHMFSELAMTRSAVLKALQTADMSLDGLSVMASIAKARASKTAELVTNEAIQMHGGIGMTDEYDVGFFIKRSRCIQALYGGYNYHVDRFATLGGY